MLRGDPEPFAELWSHTDDIVYLPAEGGINVGWEQAYSDWKRQAGASRGGDAELVDVHVAVGDRMALSAATTRARVRGTDDNVHTVELRETSVFRREGGDWRMVAHHADDFSLWRRVTGSAA